MKLILLRSCRAGTHFSVRGKVGKRRNGGGVSTPPSLHLPRNDQREFPLWNSPPPHALRCFGAFSNLSSFCIRLSVSANGHGEPTKVFVHLFQKVVGRRGKAPLALRRGRNTFSFTKRRRGAKRPGGTFGGGEPSPGVLPCGYCRISSLPPFYSAFATNSHSMKL